VHEKLLFFTLSQRINLCEICKQKRRWQQELVMVGCTNCCLHHEQQTVTLEISHCAKAKKQQEHTEK
jgi:hypothetical protein